MPCSACCFFSCLPLLYYYQYLFVYNLAPTGDDVAVRYKKESHGVQRIEFIPKQAGMLITTSYK